MIVVFESGHEFVSKWVVRLVTESGHDKVGLLEGTPNRVQPSTQIFRQIGAAAPITDNAANLMGHWKEC